MVSQAFNKGNKNKMGPATDVAGLNTFYSIHISTLAHRGMSLV